MEQQCKMRHTKQTTLYTVKCINQSYQSSDIAILRFNTIDTVEFVRNKFEYNFQIMCFIILEINVICYRYYPISMEFYNRDLSIFSLVTVLKASYSKQCWFIYV